MEHGSYGISAASELDSSPSSVASLQRTSTAIDVMRQLASRYPANATYGRTRARTRAPAPRAANRLRMSFQVGVREFFDEHGDVTRIDYGDEPYGRGRFGAIPASEEEIARLPVATAGEVRQEDCGVCLESFEEGDELRMMTCPSSHGFHEGCILRWLRVSRLCPLCRFALPAED